VSKTASPPVAGVELRLVIDWLEQLARADDLDDIAADGGVTVGMVYQQEAAMQARRLRALASPVRDDGSSADADTHRAAEGAVLADLTRASAALVKCHDIFMRAQGGASGNQADAYNIVASKWTEWAQMRGALEPAMLRMMEVRSPPASSVSPGMETLQASECAKTKHGEGDQ